MMKTYNHFRRAIFSIVLLLLCAVMAGAQLSGLRVGESVRPVTRSISQYGITWHFDRDVVYGQFVNGDYWVVGPVTVTSVDPAPSGGRNGSMINPVASQAYDSRAGAYDAELGVEYPVAIDYDASLVSTISLPEDHRYTQEQIRAAAVLTILGGAPPARAFRPGLIGSNKVIYDADDIRWDWLPTIEHGSIALPSAASIDEKYTQKMQRPWIMHVGGYLEWSAAPVENQPGYHQNWARLLSHAAVYSLVDWGNRTDLVRNYIQVGIDYYANQLQGTTRLRANYFWPTVFAGILLGDDAMRDLYKDGRQRVDDYHYRHTYFRHRAASAPGHPSLSPSGAVLGGDTPWGRDTWTGYYHRTLTKYGYGRRPVFYGTSRMTDELHPDYWDSSNTYKRMHSIGTVGFTLSMWAFGDLKYAGVNLDGDHVYAEYAIAWMHDDDEVIVDTLNAATDPTDSAWPPSSGYGSAHGYATSGDAFVDSMWHLHESDVVRQAFPR